MDELVNQLGLNLEESFSITNYVINILICSLLLFLLSFVYKKFGKSISNRSQLAKVLIIVGLTTFIIISIVKSSLALSLGLVGALSIVRFRTAIKEPEELGYFFMSIALGLGMGANQLMPTLIGFVILCVIIMVLSKLNKKSSFTQNLLLSFPLKGEEKATITQTVSDIVMDYANQVSVKRVQFSEENISMNFLINISSISQLSNLNEKLLELNDNITITFVDTEA
ncbi:MAG: DUF4956 domain-containing protein [Flavobacteriales bacterium]|tara:strand:- start:780 stop:1457 length:678 start_codon:yes stop_codon:yes gene_type:complete